MASGRQKENTYLHYISTNLPCDLLQQFSNKLTAETDGTRQATCLRFVRTEGHQAQ
jgi:hypothetical protein